MGVAVVSFRTTLLQRLHEGCVGFRALIVGIVGNDAMVVCPGRGEGFGPVVKDALPIGCGDVVKGDHCVEINDGTVVEHGIGGGSKKRSCGW